MTPPFDAQPALVDQHGRTKRKLRVSLTDRCNFRCRYCMPEHPTWLPKRELLTREEMGTLARLFVDGGIDAIRLTGGEPLLRADVVDCVAELNRLRAYGLKRLSMTTNASRLTQHLEALVAAGLQDLNISLDALRPEVFKALRGHVIDPVLEGIEHARALRVPLKLNTVLIRGQNDGEIVPLVEWAMARGLSLRFIEYMPLDAPGNWSAEHVVPEQEVLDVLRRRYRVEALPRGSDPATAYLLDGHYRLGIISTVSNPFCGSCDRLRITARGELYTCLFAQQGYPLGRRLREGASMEALETMLRAVVWNKDRGYAAHPGPVERPITMHTLGG